MSECVVHMEMPENCGACPCLDDYSDYPRCRISGEQRGYNFPICEKRMPNCPVGGIQSGCKDDRSLVRVFGRRYDISDKICIKSGCSNHRPRRKERNMRPIDADALMEKLNGIWDCNDMTFEPVDGCCIDADCKSCRWRETIEYVKRLVQNQTTIVPAAAERIET